MAKNDKSLGVSRKPNKIIEARQGLSVVQHRILFSVFAQFRTKVANLPPIKKISEEYIELIETKYSIKLNEIIPDFKKQKDGKTLLDKYEKESKDIQNQRHVVKTDDGGWESYTLIDYVRFYREESRIEVRIATSMIEEILRWYKNGFTQIPLQEIIPLRSKYAISIFEMLLRVMNIPGVKEDGYTISYEELRKRFGILPKEYKEFCDFDRRVLQQAQKEIHEKTFMRFAYRIDYEKRIAKNICFYDITHNVKEVLPAQLEIFDFDKIDADEAERAKINATGIIENSGEECFATSEKFVEERRESERWATQSSIDMKYTAEDIKRMQDNPRGFTEEQLKKLDIYLDGIFSADEVKRDYDFDYIEFYYKKTMQRHEVGGVDDFAGFLFNLIKKDSYKFYELKLKEEKKIAEELRAKKEFEEAKEYYLQISQEKKLIWIKRICAERPVFKKEFEAYNLSEKKENKLNKKLLLEIVPYIKSSIQLKK
jgi:plasmid replication initiation protein